MPELPEVEVVKLGLEKLIVGKTIDSVSHDNFKSFPNDNNSVNQFLIRSRVISIDRMGKSILINLSTDYTLLTHLKMTGQLVFVGRKQQVRNPKYENRNKLEIRNTKSETRFGGGHPNESLVKQLPDKTTRVTIKFADNTELFFNDQRKFGWMKLIATELISENSFIKKLGPEPLSTSFTNKKFIQNLRRKNNSLIKAAILDQSVLAGVGNIYADECLWMSRIHPETRVRNLSDIQIKELRKNIIKVFRISIQKGGSTDRNYIDAEGNKGSYLKFANVFRLEGKPCNRCGSEIIKVRVAGRGTHICPTCQPK